MRIQRLQLRNVRRHRELDLDLAGGGLAVIRGTNEAGKTTVQRAIELALTRKPTTAGSDVEALRPWGGNDEARPEITLEFVEDDLEGTRRGRLEKSFRGQRGSVRLEFDGEVITDPTRAEEVLADLTGIPTEAFFRSTASVRHHEIEGLDRDEGALRDRLQASISGADRGTSTAKKRLERALRDLRMRGDRNPGRLRIGEEAVAHALATVEQGEEELGLLERDRDALAAARESRREAEGELAEGRAMLEKARQAERFAQERDAATERFERYREAVRTSEEIERMAASHPSRHPLPVLRQLVERLRVLDRDIAALRATLGAPLEVDFELRVPEPTWKRWAALAILISVGSVAAAGAAVVNGLLQWPVLAGLAIAMLIGLYSAVHANRQRRAAGDFKRARQLRDDQIARRLRGRTQLELELREKEADTARQLALLELPDLPSAESMLTAEEEHTQAIDRLAARLEGSVGRQPPGGLPALRDAAALEIEQKGAALEALGPIGREPRARERLEVAVRAAEAALEDARDEESNARARVEANTVDAEEVAREAERLVAWREQLAALQRRARVYEETLTSIERAEQATMRTATRYLERRMVADLTHITDGRYRRVRVDDQNLDISVFAPEKGDWVSTSELSQGTADQVYLVARLGLVRLVTGDRRPPLIFDDPFVTFDDDRARRSVELLGELANDFQVIYLTTSDRYDSVADVVIELPPASARDQDADQAEEWDSDQAARSLAPRRAARNPGRPLIATESGDDVGGDQRSEEPAESRATGETEVEAETAADSDMVFEGGPVDREFEEPLAEVGESRPAQMAWLRKDGRQPDVIDTEEPGRPARPVSRDD